MTDPTTDIQEKMIALVRTVGLHHGDRTPCGKSVSVAEAQALLELTPRTRSPEEHRSRA